MYNYKSVSSNSNGFFRVNYNGRIVAARPEFFPSSSNIDENTKFIVYDVCEKGLCPKIIDSIEVDGEKIVEYQTFTPLEGVIFTPLVPIPTSR